MENNAKHGARSTDGLSFIHSTLDDFGLNPTQFRVYCHVARRAGRDGKCSDSVATFGKACGLHPNTVRPALKLLVEHRLLSMHPRRGQTTFYRRNPWSEWIPLPDPSQELLGVPPHKKPYGTPPKDCEGNPSQKTGAKGTPSEVSPFKETSPPRQRWQIQKDIESVNDQIVRARNDRALWTDQHGTKRPEAQPKPEAQKRIAALKQRLKELGAEMDALT